MSLNETIRSALASLGRPCVPSHYTGTESIYLTFNYNLIPVSYADDAPAFYHALIQVHLFGPIGENLLALRDRIPGLLVSAGLDWAAVEDAGDDQQQHIVYETSTLEPLEVDDDGTA